MRAVLCAHLCQWPIDRLRRRHKELRRKALVLVETTASRQKVMHVSPEIAGDVWPGMTLPQARHGALMARPYTPGEDGRALGALARWLVRFSPSVCVYSPSEIFLDATGLERLFHGLENLGRLVWEALARLGITARVAIAPSPGAAWAMGRFGRDPYCVMGRQDVGQSLRSLPAAALRLENGTVELLADLGIGTIGALLKLPRDELAVRFGAGLLNRIDQAMGALHEPLTFLEHRVPVRAEMEFDGAVESLQTIELAVRQLTEEAARQLAVRGLGARELHLVFRRPYAAAVEKKVRLLRACRDERGLWNLLRCAMETMDAGQSITAVVLSASATERLDDAQPALPGGQADRAAGAEAAEVDHLIEYLGARLGDCVQSARLVESHVPESAFQCREWRTRGGAAANPVGLLRPLHLLPSPREIRVMAMPLESRESRPISFTDLGRVHRLSAVRGPERIGGAWWNGRWKTRDYFDAIDEAGRRYWIFRVMETGKWFLQGVFA